MKQMHVFLLALFAFLFGGVAAFAADTAPIVVPWGAWIHDILSSLSGVAVTAASAVVAWLAPPYVRMLISDRMVANAVNFALAKVDDAVVGKTLELHVANAVVDRAVRYAVTSEPKVAKWVGANLQPLVIAKLSALGCAPLKSAK